MSHLAPQLHSTLATPAMTWPEPLPNQPAATPLYPGTEPNPRLIRGIAWALSISLPLWAGFVAILWLI